MAALYAYTAAIWPPLLGAIFLAAMGLYAWRRRDVPAGKPFVAASLFGSLVLLGIALEAAAVLPETKIAWYKFQFVMQVATVTAGTCFTLEYVYPGRWLTRRNVALLSIPPILTLLLSTINDGQLIWQRLHVRADGSLVPYFAIPGAVLLAYAWGLIFVNAVAFLWLFIHSPQHRWPVALLLFGQLAGRAAYVFYVAGLPALTPLDPYVLAFCLTWTMYGIALFGFRIFDPLPAARQTIVEQMRAGVLVFDRRWHVASLNSAAEMILGIRASTARGKTWRQLAGPGELLPDLPDVGTSLVVAETELPEMTIGTGSSVRHYAPTLTALKDFRGLLMGYVLILRDVTEQKRDQARMLQQQWTEATLQERVQLAQELHDGLSQNLGFLNLQAQAAQLYLQGGQSAAAQANLGRLAEVARGMQGDVRELIGSLLAVSLPAEGFCDTLRHMAEEYEQQYGLPARLDVDSAAEALCEPGVLSAAVGVQLVRIAQEALANVRKHACSPDHVDVQLRAEARLLRLAIADNGPGFDPAQVSSSDGHFGLQVMQQRAARAGGQLMVHSAPGQGTRIEVCVPVGRDAETG